MQDVHSTLQNGSVVKDRYVVESLLGKGGFGAVYRVRDIRVQGNQFALKEVINPNKDERERFAFECAILTRLDHPALPRVYRVFEDDQAIRVYMLMDYVAGPNLETLRQQKPDKRFSLAQALRVLNPIMDAVSYLHEQQPPIIHRDIKPANIIVPDTPEESVLVDFGIAKEYEQDSTTTAVRRCSPGYGAPEQYAYGTDTRTDVYGIGATLYALLTGFVPVDALFRLTQMGSRRSDPLEPVHQLEPSIPIAVSDAIQRALSIDGAERFVSVKEFQQALNEQSSVEPSIAAQSSPVLLATEDMPTKTSLSSNIGEAGKQTPLLSHRREKRTRRRTSLLALFVLLALIALIALVIGASFGIGLFQQKAQSGPISARTATMKPKATLTSTVSGATATSSATPRATAIPTKTPTTSPPTITPSITPTVGTPVYPTLANTYNGQLTNTVVNESAPITLSSITQHSANISGQLYIAPGHGLEGSGSFTGTVSTQNGIYFVVAAYGGNDPLAFGGTIQAGGGMMGSYCSLNSNGSCDNLQGRGTWYTNAPSALQPLNPLNDARALLNASYELREKQTILM